MKTKIRFVIIALAVTLSACAHTYYEPTGLPTDVQDRFYFHVDIEAQERGLRTSRAEESLTVYANDGRITYAADGGEIVGTITIPNKRGATVNYYRQKANELEDLSQGLVNGARKRARQAKDFAY